MATTIYKGIEIRDYCRGGVFTDDLECKWMCDGDGNAIVKMHATMQEAMDYIDARVKMEQQTRFFIATYTMPQGCTAWIPMNRFPSYAEEDKVFAVLQEMSEEVKQAYPDAKPTHRLLRRSVEQAFNDRESSICSREWLIEEKGKQPWRYRLTMYAEKVAA